MEEIVKSDGLNESERYLSRMSQRTFLSLWSYPNPHKQVGTELADLLAIHGQDVLIFSDKDIGWSGNSDLKVAWARWYKRAVLDGAASVHGAARWIRQHPTRVFLDAKNKAPIPIDVSAIPNPIFHLICVCSGVENIIKSHYKDASGTFMLSSHISGDDHLSKAGSGGYPYFSIGDVTPDKDFVHVFSRSGLECVMHEFDTIVDFTGYLKWRADGFRNKRIAFVPGEEELVAVYWGQMKSVGWDLSKMHPAAGAEHGLTVLGGCYREMCLSADYLSWRMACEESLFWDGLIEEFSRHVFSGKVPVVAGFTPSFEASERVLRFMAAETRQQRIVLAQAFKGMMIRSVEDQADRYVRKFPLRSKTDTYGYVFMVSTFDPNTHDTYEEYRDGRAAAIWAYCLDILHSVPQLQHVIGIALDTSPMVSGRVGRSEDVMAVERPDFDDELIGQLNQMRADLEMQPINVKQLLKDVSKIDRSRKRFDSGGGGRKKRAFRV